MSWNYIYFGLRQTHPAIIGDLLNSSGPIAVDIETVNLVDRTLVGVGFSNSPDDSYFIHPDSPLMPTSMLEDPHILKVFHNAEYDVPVLEQRYGIQIRNYTDTLIEARLLGMPPKLSTLADLILGKTGIEIEDLIGSGKNQLTMRDVPITDVAKKCGYDTRFTWEIHQHLVGRVPKKALDLELRVMPILRDIEKRGMYVNQQRLLEHRQRLSKNVDFFRRIALGMGFNPGSSQQVAPILHSRGMPIRYGKPGPKTGKRQVKLTKEMLESYPYNLDPLATLVAKFRQERSADTMLDRVNGRLIDDRWHFRFQQVATDSGRLSTTPNSQNITVELRDIFEATPGNIMEIGDFSQIELRVLNYLAKDPYMDQVFNDYDTGKGVNIHRATQGGLIAQGISHITYGLAKNINFTVIYLGDEHTLEQRYGVPLEVGAKFIQGYFTTYPGVKRWLDETIVDIRRKGYAETLYGRKREFPDLQDPKSPPWSRNKAIREGVNHIIQGSAGEINKECLILMSGDPIINNVHDEILVDISPGYIVKWPGPADLAPFNAPIESGQGPNWKVAKP